jgi:hypothetical protein
MWDGEHTNVGREANVMINEWDGEHTSQSLGLNNIMWNGEL